MDRKLKEEIKRDEGFRGKIYEDTHGNKTIGYGWNLENGISKELASIVLDYQIKEIETDLAYRIPFWNKLSRMHQNILVNVAFNVGVDGLMKFKKMLDAMKNEQWSRARYELLDSKAAMELHNRYNRLADKMIKG